MNAHAPASARRTLDEAARAVRKVLPETVAVYRFGSWGTPWERPGSDLDLAVLLPHKESREVDPWEWVRLNGEVLAAARMDRVDLVNLRAAGNLLQAEVLRADDVVFCRDEDARLRFEVQALAACQDLRRWREALRESFLAEPAGRAGGRAMSGVLLEKLAQMNRCAQRIQDAWARTSGRPFEEDLDKQDVVLLNLQRMIQAMLDGCQHVIRVESLGWAQDHAKGFALLAEAGWISAREEKALRGASGLRNIMVHEYARLDLGIVRRVVEENRPADLQKIARALAARLEADTPASRAGPGGPEPA